MSVEICEFQSESRFREGQAVFVCNTTECAFGPVMKNTDEAQMFKRWLKHGPRIYDQGRLKELYGEFRSEIAEEADQ